MVISITMLKTLGHGHCCYPYINMVHSSYCTSEYLGDENIPGLYIGGYQPLEGTDVQEFIWIDGSLWHDKPFDVFGGQPVINPDKRCLSGRWTSNRFVISNQFCNQTDYGSVCRKPSCE